MLANHPTRWSLQIKRWSSPLLAASIVLVSALQIWLGWNTAHYDAQIMRSGAGSTFVDRSRLRRMVRAPPPRRVSINSNFNDVTISPETTQSFMTKLIQLLSGGSTSKNYHSSVPSNPPLIVPDWYQPNAEEQFVDEAYDLNVCEPMFQWQLKSNPNCNTFHELDLSELKYIASGGARSTFELSEDVAGMKSYKFVYKNFHFDSHERLKPWMADMERKDALVMGRTSSSPFIQTVFGYCSVASIAEIMSGSLEQYRRDHHGILLPIERLKIAIHLASGVADLHSIDNSTIPSFCHDDLKETQYLYQGGIFKLGDFNYGKPIYLNKTSNDQCRISYSTMWHEYPRHHLVRALEEHQIKLESKDFTPVPPDKIDVWMLGNILYTLMTDKSLFSGLTHADTITKKLVAGERSYMPKHVTDSNDPSYIILRKTLDMCWTSKWEYRASSRMVADYLLDGLRSITGEDHPDLRVTWER